MQAALIFSVVSIISLSSSERWLSRNYKDVAALNAQVSHAWWWKSVSDEFVLFLFAWLFFCSREKELAKNYYDKLFKEYCIADLSRYKENKVGWTDDMIQTEIQPL